MGGTLKAKPQKSRTDKENNPMTWKEIFYKLLKLGLVCFTLSYITSTIASFIRNKPASQTTYNTNYYEAQRSELRDSKGARK